MFGWLRGLFRSKSNQAPAPMPAPAPPSQASSALGVVDADFDNFEDFEEVSAPARTAAAAPTSSRSVIGIDLGTTNSCVAVYLNGKPEVLTDTEGLQSTPSVVAFSATGDELVGEFARRQAVTNPEYTFFAVKRLIGRKFEDSIVREMQARACYRLHRSKNGEAWVRGRDRPYSPQEISAAILSKARETAEQYLGAPVDKAVITVPAYYNDRQRQAVKDAAHIAGLEPLRIINEPTAAAMAYGLGNAGQGSKIVAVCDFGGGTFNVSILRFESGVFEVMASTGDTYLGGEDFDGVLIDHICNRFEAETGVDLRDRDSRVVLQRVRAKAEEAKKELSRLDDSLIAEPCYSQVEPGRIRTERTRTRVIFLFVNINDGLWSANEKDYFL